MRSRLTSLLQEKQKAPDYPPPESWGGERSARAGVWRPTARGPRFASQTLGLSKAPVALWKAAEPADKLARKMPSFSHFDSVHPLGVPDNVPIKRKRMLNLTAIKTANHIHANIDSQRASDFRRSL